MDLPLELLRSIALRELGRASAGPLFVTLSGAHLYGFASPDSDFDVRGCHVLPLDRVIGLQPPLETIERSTVEEGREVDFVSHDAGKFFRMLLKKNGYVLEQVFSPLVVSGGPDLEELRTVARGCLTRHLFHHYRGFSENEIASLERQAEKRAKTLLYVYRVLLTGIHVLEAGEIEADLQRLLDLHPQPTPVRELISLKVREAAVLEPSEVAPHLSRIAELRGELERAFERSALPESPARAEDLDRFLVRLRLAAR
jgi:uncharacterized protein